ncbi:MAG: hypothetical protein IPH35_23490 [Rhodoferax sp.]|nr:hypothetical protein [Rhodoferax sp.]
MAQPPTRNRPRPLRQQPKRHPLPPASVAPKTADVEVKPSSDPKAAGYPVREALGLDTVTNKKLTLVAKSKPSGAPANPRDAAHEAPAVAGGARQGGHRRGGATKAVARRRRTRWRCALDLRG